MKNEHKLSINQGEDFIIQLELRGEDNVPLDLTDHTFEGQIRNTASSDSIVASFTFEVLDQITDTGKVLVSLSASDTSDIPLPYSKSAYRRIAIFAYDIESEAYGRKYRWLGGVLTISPEVTR